MSSPFRREHRECVGAAEWCSREGERPARRVSLSTSCLCGVRRTSEQTALLRPKCATVCLSLSAGTPIETYPQDYSEDRNRFWASFELVKFKNRQSKKECFPRRKSHFHVLRSDEMYQVYTKKGVEWDSDTGNPHGKIFTALM